MTTKELIAEVNNMKKWNYTLAPQEVFDEIIKGLKALDTSCRDCDHFGDWHYCKNCYGYDSFKEVEG